MLSMTDKAPDGPPAMPFLPLKRKSPSSDSTMDVLMQPLSGVMKSARRLGEALVERGAGIWDDPAKAVDLASQGSALTSEIANLAFMGQDSPTRFKGQVDIAKRVAWADPLPLDEVKTIGRALGASINDICCRPLPAHCEVLVAKAMQSQAHRTCARAVPASAVARLQARINSAWCSSSCDRLENPVERLYALRANMNA